MVYLLQVVSKYQIYCYFNNGVLQIDHMFICTHLEFFNKFEYTFQTLCVKMYCSKCVYKDVNFKQFYIIFVTEIYENNFIYSIV